MGHYVHGLQYMSRTYDRRTGKADSTCGKYRISKRKRIKDYLHTKMSNKKADRFAEDFKAESANTSGERSLGPLFTVRAGSTHEDSRVEGSKSSPESALHSTREASKDRNDTVKNDTRHRKKRGGNADISRSRSEKKQKNPNQNPTGRSADAQVEVKKKHIMSATEGLYMTTDLRTDAALTLKLLPLEALKGAPSDSRSQFYAFV